MWAPCCITIRHIKTKRCSNPSTHRQSLADNRIDQSNRLRPEARYVLPSNKTTLDQCNQSWFANTAYTIHKKMQKRLASHCFRTYTLQPNRLHYEVSNGIQLDGRIASYRHKTRLVDEYRIDLHPNVQYGIPAKFVHILFVAYQLVLSPETNLGQMYVIEVYESFVEIIVKHEVLPLICDNGVSVEDSVMTIVRNHRV